MKQVNRKRMMVGHVSRCLPMLFCFLCVILMSASHVASQTEGSPAPVQDPQQGDTSSAEIPTFQPPGALVPPPAATSTDASAEVERVKESLTKGTFAYVPASMLDPFVPFISPSEVVPQPRGPEAEEEELAPEQKRPLTPLQKMTLAEIEKGLKAITWGEMGRKAVIEDSAGKGYIVGVGTPAGDRNGVIMEIFNDRLVIQQESWDRQAKRMVISNSIVKLKKDVKEQ